MMQKNQMRKNKKQIKKLFTDIVSEVLFSICLPLQVQNQSLNKV